MTSTITAEERAKAVHDEFFIPGSGDAALERTLIALIAAAIRDAEREARNSALEDAAAACAGTSLRAFDNGYDRAEAAIAMTVAVRSLKSPSPPQGHE